MMEPKVSVVVPMYKVEPYLCRCVDSIRKQTYTNLEIVLVNDGSPDRSGEIAEQYAARDERIQVIHKPNGGLSDARNAGMRSVTGAYTVFVDSDDWLNESMIETLVEHAEKYKADVVQSAFYYAYDDHLLYDNRYFAQGDPPIVLGRQELMAELVMNEKVKNFAWGKLYRTKLIQDIPFRKGVLFEDIFWAYQVIHRIRSYVIVHRPMYFYYQRADSIVASYTPRNLDMIRGLKERHRFIERHYHHLTDESYKAIVKASLTHYNLLLANRKKDKGGVHRKKVRAYIQAHYAKLKTAVEHDAELKRQLQFFMLHPYVNILYLARNKLLRKCRLLPQPPGLQKLTLKN